jgi:hypothetical protein
VKLEIDTDYLDPITLDPYEHVSVTLPDGREVTVWAGQIKVRTREDVARGRDGKTIWRAMSSRSRLWPYGKVRQPGGKDGSDEEGAESRSRPPHIVQPGSQQP